MTSLLRKLSLWLDCLAFANVGHIGEFNRLLQQRHPAPGTAAATGKSRQALRQDASFARWLALWNGTPAEGTVGGLRGRVDENV